MPKTVVNLRELADILGKRDKTVARMIRKNPDFPVLSGGRPGVPYAFDLDAVKDWVRQTSAADVSEENARAEQLSFWRGVLGTDTGEDKKSGPVLTPQLRRVEAEAVRVEDYNRRQRKELLPREEFQEKCERVVVETRQRLLDVADKFARRHALSPEQRIALKTMIRDALNGIDKEMGKSAFHAAGVTQDAIAGHA